MRTVLVSHTDLLGKNICFLRRQKRISMDRFCQMYDIPKDMLFALELGERPDLYLDAALAIAGDFGIDINDLIQKDFTDYDVE